MLLSVLAIFNLHWFQLLSTKVHSLCIILYKYEISSLGVEGSLMEKKMKKKSNVHEIDNCTDYRMQMT